MGFCNYYVAYAFVVCVQINNEELFFNAFPFENSYYFISEMAIGGCVLRERFTLAKEVRSTGNLSSVYKPSSCTYNVFECIHHFRAKYRESIY